jgi:hypothetical protein
VHAVLFDLEARIDGRVVTARARRRGQAREAYEDAIESGKAAVLHEEVLRGVHMLSVAHLGPGKEIEVTSRWAAALSVVGDQGQLRIPLTIGDIYGRSGLPDSDDLLIGGPAWTADLFVRCKNGVVAVRGARLDEGHTRVALNAPIDLVVTHAADQELRGVAADGREVVLRISPHRGGDKALDVAVVVDRSSSMDEVCTGRAGRITKHAAVIIGLRSASHGLGEDDIIDLWEFNDQLAHVGSSHGPASGKRGRRQQLVSLIAGLTHPAGGTEIGAALSGTIAASDARDILLITDGKSYALDVHELARMGRRITVLLVGEDSLEANVGHLAALSGCDIFVAAGDDLDGSLVTAINALRMSSERSGPVEAPFDRVRVVRGNALLEAEWRPATEPVLDAPRNRSVAALGASLALPLLDEEQAALLAEAEGLVTHLTSLVLVDEEGEVLEGIPATRKVALPAPSAACVDMSIADRARGRSDSRNRYPSHAPACSWASGRRQADTDESQYAFERAELTLLGLGLRIEWDLSPKQLLAGDLSALDPQDASLIERVAELPEVIAIAEEMNIDPTVLVVTLIARSQSSENRSAARIAKAILGDQLTDEMIMIAALLGLD